jgi:oxidase EvaA
VRGWRHDEQTGNIFHESGAFFSIEGAPTIATNLREAPSWDQPIYNQKEGGVLALICKQEGDILLFLLYAKAEPGNLGGLQLSPSAQCTWSNLRQAHKGKRPPLAEFLLGEVEAKVVYKAQHNEEGGRFWRKSNSNQIYLVDVSETPINDDPEKFFWATLSQIKALALIDNVLSPFVKTIIAPL